VTERAAISSYQIKWSFFNKKCIRWLPTAYAYRKRSEVSAKCGRVMQAKLTIRSLDNRWYTSYMNTSELVYHKHMLLLVSDLYNSSVWSSKKQSYWYKFEWANIFLVHWIRFDVWYIWFTWINDGSPFKTVVFDVVDDDAAAALRITKIRLSPTVNYSEKPTTSFKTRPSRDGASASPTRTAPRRRRWTYRGTPDRHLTVSELRTT